MNCVPIIIILLSNHLSSQMDDIYFGPTLSTEVNVKENPEKYYPLAVGNSWEFAVLEESLKGEKPVEVANWTIVVEIIAKLQIPQGTLFLRGVKIKGSEKLSSKIPKYSPSHLFESHLLVVDSYVFSIPFAWWDETRQELIDTAKSQFECKNGKGLVPDFFFPLMEGICWKNPSCERTQIDSRPSYKKAMLRIMEGTKNEGDDEIVKKYQAFFYGAKKVEGKQTLVVEYAKIEDAWLLELNRLGGGSVCFFKEGIGPVYLSSVRGGSSVSQISASLLDFKHN